MSNFSWMGDLVGDDAPAWVSVRYLPRNPMVSWEVTLENIPGQDDYEMQYDDAASAWSDAAIAVHNASGGDPDETDKVTAAAPDYLEWCFDGQVGLYCYDPEEED